MAITPGSILRYRPQMWALSQLGENILWYKRTDVLGTNPAELATVQAFDALFAPLYKPLISSAAVYLGSSLQVVSPTLGVSTKTALNAGAGTSGPDLLGTQIAGLISKRTALGGRKNRGRMYVPFPSESDSVAGVPTAAYEVNLVNLGIQVVSMITVGAGYTFEPYIVRRVAGVYVADQRITDYINQLGWATQRRRGFYGRQNPQILT